jgi:hypothetical protein
MKKSAIMIAILIILIFVSGCVQAPMNDIQIDKDLENLVTSTENSTAESNKSQAKNINNPPHLDPIGDKTINEESTLIFRISASDSDNNTLIYSVSNLPTGATFDTVTQTFSWKPSQAKGSYHVIFTVTDGILYDSESIIITAIQPAGTEIKHIKNTSISGKINENQIWSGDILITGDTHISGDLTILPGTTISFVVGDDVGWGNEIAPDGYNDLDPTRLKSYETTHSDLSVTGKLIAKGTPDKKIRFTSAAAKPDYADWVGIHVGADNSIMEYCIIEWSRHGIGLGNNIPNTIIQNNIINYTFWGSISSGHSSAQIYNNEI